MLRASFARLSLPFMLVGLAACGASGGDPLGPGNGGPDPGGAVSKWSEPASWASGVVPVAGADVEIPAGRTIRLDVSPPALGKVTVNGRLRFDDVDLALTANAILVNGALEVGTEAQPYTKRALITLTGTDPGATTAPFGAKALGVAGIIDLHGQSRTTWARLASTADVGATTLTLDRSPGWRVGERIVIASTDFDPMQAQEGMITAVAGVTVTIDKPLTKAHYGVTQSLGGVQLDERAEVALLSHNITVRSDSASTAGGFGGHLIIVRGATARIEGVEFYLMGQKKVVGRYPVHWHMAASVAGQYIRGSSVWKSFNRCITVHGTNDAVVQQNVCYDHLGHGFFLEDGAETGNTLKENLGLVTRRPVNGEEILASDKRPATYWITNPDNTFTGNVAAGSQSIGFWVALPEQPTGLSTGTMLFPRRTPLREFSGNVSHSSFDTGLNVDDGPKPDGTTETTNYRARQTPADANSATVTTVFKNFTAWKHRGRGVWLRGTQHLLDGALLADNAIGATFASSESFLVNSVVIGQSANSGGTQLSSTARILGYEFYDGRVGATAVKFINFQPTGGQSVGAIGNKLDNSFSISPGNFAGTLQFTNAIAVFMQTPPAGRDGNRMALFFDSLGTVSGTAGRYVVANEPVLVTPACTQRTDWNAWICPLTYANLRINSGVTAENVNPLTLTRDDAVALSLVGIGNDATTTDNTSANANLPTARRYRVTWNGAAPTQPYFTFTKARVGDWVRLEVPYPNGNVNVFRNYNRSASIPAAASIAEVDASTGNRFFYDTGTGILHLKLQASSASDYGNTLFVEPKS